MCQKFVSGLINSTPIYCCRREPGGSKPRGTPSTARVIVIQYQRLPHQHELIQMNSAPCGSQTASGFAHRTLCFILFFHGPSVAPLAQPVTFSSTLFATKVKKDISAYDLTSNLRIHFASD